MNGVVRDEGAHEAFAVRASESWAESWDLEFVALDGSIGGFVRFARLPNQRRVWCWVYVLRAEGTIVVRDHDVPLPAPERLLARSEGLWCELVCEVPMEHWSIGVEAFGVQLDDPLDGLRGEIGTRMPVGLDLEWEALANAGALLDASGCDGYEQFGIVHGDVLLGTDVIPFDGLGVRRHAWGDRDWSRPVDTLWCAREHAHWSFARSDSAPFATTSVCDAVIPLSDHGERGPFLKRSMVAVTDERPEWGGYGMRDRVYGPTE